MNGQPNAQWNFFFLYDGMTRLKTKFPLPKKKYPSPVPLPNENIERDYQLPIGNWFDPRPKIVNTGKSPEIGLYSEQRIIAQKANLLTFYKK